MARQVLPWVGAAIGAYFGNPQIGFAIGSIVGNLVDPVVNQGPRLGELPTQTSSEGFPRAIIYGTATCTGYIASFNEVRKITVTTEGDKGGPKTESEAALRSYNIIICEGPIGGVPRIWKNDKLVVDLRPGSQMLEESAKWLANKTLYLGGEDQLPDTWLQQHVSGPTTTPAYRDSAHLVFMDEDVTDTAGAIPQYRFEVAKAVTTEELEHVESEIGHALTGGTNSNPLVVDHSSFPFNASQLAPLMLMSSSLVSHVSDFSTPIRMIVYIGGAVVFDTGWFSDFPDTQQEELDELLTDQDLPTLIGTITDTWEKSVEIHVTPEMTSGTIEYYRAGVPSAVNNFNTVSLGWIYPDTDLEPKSGYTFHPTVDGVGVRTDGSMFSASWGPDEITVIGSSMLLSEIVSDLHSRASIDDEDFDVAELVDMVDGLTLTGDYSAADAINTLRSCYFFDKAEPGDKLYYPKRGKPVVMTLTFDDLVDVPDLSKREQVGEVPKKMHLLFQNAIAGYAPVKASYERSSIDVLSVVETTMQVPVCLNMDEGQRMVHKIMKVSTADAGGEIKLTLPERLIALIPSDNVGLSLRGQLRRLRIDEQEWADGVLSPTLRVDRQSAYTSTLTGVPIPPPALPPSTIVGETAFVFADVSSRVDTEDDLHYLVAGTSPMPGWYGWLLQRSLDAGASYANVDTYQVADVIGTLLDAVPIASTHYTDTTNTVRVQLYRDGQALESITEVQFLSEGGAFLLEKADGSYEVMQALDWDDEGDGIFAGTTLHRGRLHSVPSAHSAGARFVLLQDCKHVPAVSAWIGLDLTHRAVSLSESPELADEQTDTYIGRSQLEWEVAYLTVERDMADVITGGWYARDRFGTDASPVASQNFRGYRVTLDDGVLPAVTFDTLATSFTYDASALGTPLTVSVAGINRITGAGPATSESI